MNWVENRNLNKWFSRLPIPSHSHIPQTVLFEEMFIDSSSRMTKTQQGQTFSIREMVLGNRSQLYKLSIDYESKVNVNPDTYL